MSVSVQKGGFCEAEDLVLSLMNSTEVKAEGKRTWEGLIYQVHFAINF